MSEGSTQKYRHKLACMRGSKHTHTCMHTHVDAHKHARTQAYMHTYTHTHTHAHVSEHMGWGGKLPER